eukprot:GHVU01019778.1.p1 GENE.GHVU01019778.1~~GHVU01019778.1.p1  ORF type:complete len:137 (+),score=11.99 GHVU01019778.1:67-477(+)
MVSIPQNYVPDIGESRLKRTLYIGGLDEQVTKETLKAAFIPFGDIRSVDIPCDRNSGASKGFGFVEFEDEEDALHALENMHESELYGRVLTVTIARVSAFAKLEPNKPVWADDFFFRRRLADAGMPVGSEEVSARK